MSLILAGKAVLVATASKGLGKAVAAGFAAEGTSVAMCGRGLRAIEAAAVVILRSPANTYVTRQSLLIDGGLTRSM